MHKYEDEYCYPRIERNEGLLVKPPSNAVSFYVMMDAEGLMKDRGVKIGITEGGSDGLKKRKAKHEDRGSLGVVKMNFMGSCFAMGPDETQLKTRWRECAVKDRRTNGNLRNIADKTEWFDLTKGGAVGEELRNWIRWWTKQPYVESDIAKISRDTMQMARAHLWMPPAHADSSDRIVRQGFLPYNPWRPEVTDNDYYTPDLITHLARLTMQGIELDPSSCKLANNGASFDGVLRVGVRAKDYFDISDDALTLTNKSWSARSAFINYPFNQMDWVRKVLSVVKNGYIDEFILFMSAMASNNKACTELIDMCDLCIPRQRMNCWGPKSFSSNYYGVNILYYGPHRDRFRKFFGTIGAIKRT